ncbi:MAG TPA: DNA-protecting protein DprA, partial [Pelagibacterium sp.]|nr:DNA-protecting protein DprA [Pelagibacterium sp.]
SHAPTATDMLIEATGIAAPVMQILLLELELAGRIERSAGQLFALRA